MKFTTISRKITLASLVICLIVMALTLTILNAVIVGYVNRIELNDIDDIFADMDLIFLREEGNLKRTALDWSHWDDTYNYLAGRKADFAEINLRPDTLRHIGINFMIITDLKGNIINSVKYDLAGNVLKTFEDKLQNENKTLLKLPGQNGVRTGLMSINGSTFIVAVSSVTSTDEKAIANGTLIIGNRMDDALLFYMNSMTGSQIRISQNPKARNSGEIIEKTADLLMVHRPISDINDNYGLEASLVMPRSHFTLGKYYINVFTKAFLLMLCLILPLILYILRKTLIDRLTSIHSFIKTVTKTKDTSVKLDISGNDELAEIAGSINQMLFKLTEAYNSQRIIDERIQKVMEATDDGYLEYDFKTREYYISPKWSQINANQAKNTDFDPLAEYLKRVHPDYIDKVQEEVAALFDGSKDYAEMEYKMITTSGEYSWILQRAKIIERDPDGKAVKLVATLMNITTRKEFEEKILKLSYYDSTTGLRNRVYMEEQFGALELLRELNYFIIMGDVNGLKIVNDTFGHKEGDRLIRVISQILVSESAKDDIVARWGGDEFILLVLNKDDDYVVHLIERIKAECSKVGSFGVNVSIALGGANSKERSDIESVMSLAEERMYRSKLTEEKSVRSATITSLEQTLYEKHSETEEHTQRIKNLALKLGAKLNLSQDQLFELELLSLLHDIGKIGIPEQILMKPGKLTDDEWLVIKRHAEIGYRIAKSTPGLAHVAEEILSHHEKYDGTGYPQGLQGSEIPILARIISVVDSFDVMTNKRIYKEESTADYAIEELKRCSGSQFDPMIVRIFLEQLKDEGIS